MEFLQKLIQEQEPCVLCLQETNFKDNKYTNLKNFNIAYKNRISSRIASGGVAIYLKHNISYVEIPLNTDIEAIAISGIIHNREICICNVYIPNNFDLQEAELSNLIMQLPTPFLLVGDFNCHNTLWGSTSTDARGRIIEKILLKSEIILINTNEPTHFNMANGSFSSIDLAFCSPSLHDIVNFTVMSDLYNSDHFPLFIEIINNDTNSHSGQTRWKFKKADWPVYKLEIIRNLPLLRNPDVFKDEDINQIVEDFTTLITEAASTSIPKTSNNSKKGGLPWWNEECQKAIKDKKHAFNVYKKHKTFSNLLEFKRTRAIARKVLKQAKRSSWTDYVTSLTKNTPCEVMWNKLKKINGRNVNPQITSMKNSDNSIITDAKEIANLFANVFAKNSSDVNFEPSFLEFKKRTEETSRQETIVVANTHQSFNAKILITELQAEIKSTKNSSPGPDNIPNLFIKQLPSQGLNYLLEIYNHIWINGIFPNKWREAIVIPIPKPGKNKNCPDSYRPIALTCCLCKLLERILNKRLRWYLECNNILDKNQNGFRTNRSTIDSLTILDSNICTALLNKLHLIAVCLDIEKAYDMLWRHRIIKKLEDWGIDGNMLKFVSNFLKNRHIYVRVNGEISRKTEISNGVPQGSVLSVTLFLIAINDINKAFKRPIKYTIFADDCTFFTTGKNINTSQQILQEGLNKLQNFASQTGFKFSKNKTTVTIFSKNRKSREHQLQLYLGGKLIKRTDAPKILGLTFDEKHTWIPFLKNLKTECNRRLNLLKIIASKNWGAEYQVLIKSYKALVLAKLDYGAVVYGSAKQNSLKILSPIHNAGARIATGAFCTSPETSLLCEANLSSLDIRRKKLLATYATAKLATPTNPVCDTISDSTYLKDHDLKPFVPKPINFRFNKILHNLEVYTHSIMPKKQYQFPPWTIETPNIISKLMSEGKNTHPAVLESLYSEISHSYPNHQQIFTDASKSEEGTGCAICTPEDKHLFKLPDIFSIFSGEAYAILQALIYVEKSKYDKFIIFSDSKSVILAIQDLATKNPIIQNIIEMNVKLKDLKKDVWISWIPAHIGIKGNEEADSAAKLACCNNTSTTSDKPVVSKDLQNFLVKAITETWNEEWKNSRFTKLHEIRNSTNDYNPALALSRRDQTVLTRTRIGHTNWSHSHLLYKSEPELCENCGISNSIKHILTVCPKYSSQRSQHNLPNSLGMLQEKESARKVLSFLKDIGLYHVI